MIRVRVDFNSVDEDGYVRALQRRATGKVSPGDEVVAFDADGNSCLAVVETLTRDGRMALELVIATWSEVTGAGASEAGVFLDVGRVAEATIEHNELASPTSVGLLDWSMA